MSEDAPIEVVLLAPPRAHPLAGTLRSIVERVARRGGVRYREHAPEDGGGDQPARARFIVAIDASALRSDARPVAAREPQASPTPTLVLTLADSGSGAPTWIVPEVAFGRPIDGLERVARLGSALGAALDLAAVRDGLDHLGKLIASGPWHVLAGTAHLSGPSLADAVARQLAARAAATLVASLDDGGDWEIDAWELPAELDEVAVSTALEHVLVPDARAQVLVRGAPDRAASDDAAPLLEPYRVRALDRAEAFVAEVRASVDEALATHGLSALKALQRAVRRLIERVALPASPRPSLPMPSDAAVKARAAELATLPPPLPGSALTIAAWAGPSAVLAGVALGPLDLFGPSLETWIPGASPAVSGALGAAVFLVCAGLGAAALVLRRRRAARALGVAERDHQAALADVAVLRRAALAPDLVRPARTWLAAELARELERLFALEAGARAAGRAGEPIPLEAPSGAAAVDVAVDLAPARALLDPSPELLVQAVRAELGPGWREALPTLIDLRRAALHQASGLLGRAPWDARSDVAHALEAPLAQALQRVDAGLARLVPRGLPVRRLVLAPPSLAGAVPRAGDMEDLLPARDDAHLVVLWRSR